MIHFSLNNLRPIPAPRPRVSRHGTYNPAKYTNYKKLIQAKIRGFTYLGNVPLKCTLVFVFKRAKSCKNNKYSMPSGDIDNLQKGIFDAMEGILYKNDTQIVSVNAIKKYGDEDSVEVKIETLNFEDSKLTPN